MQEFQNLSSVYSFIYLRIIFSFIMADMNITDNMQEDLLNKLKTWFISNQETVISMQKKIRNKNTNWCIFTDAVTIGLGQTNSQQIYTDTMGRSRIENKLFYRLTVAITLITQQLTNHARIIQSTYIPPICLFGDPPVDCDSITDYEALKGLGELINLFMLLWNFIKSCYKLFYRFLRNMHGLFSEKHKEIYGTYHNIEFRSLWRSLSEFIGTLVALEDIMLHHDPFKMSITTYRKVINTMLKNPKKCNADPFELDQFLKILNKIELDLAQGTILLSMGTYIEDSYDKYNLDDKNLYHTFLLLISNSIDELANTINADVYTYNTPYKQLGPVGLIQLLFYSFPAHASMQNSDITELIYKLWSISYSHPIIHISGTTVIKYPFLLAYKFSLVIRTQMNNPSIDCIKIITDHCDVIGKASQVEYLYNIITRWSQEFTSTVQKGVSNGRTAIRGMLLMIHRGIQFAYKLRKVILSLIYTHQAAEKPLTMTMVQHIYQCCVLLIFIRSIFHQQTNVIASLYQLMVSEAVFPLRKQLYDFYQKLGSTQHEGTQQHKNQYNAIGQAITLLEKPITSQVLELLETVLDIAFSRTNSGFSHQHVSNIFTTLNTIKKLIHFQKHLGESTDCGFLYWQRVVLYPLFFKNVLNNSLNVYTIPYIAIAMDDCLKFILQAKHTQKPQKLVKKYKEFVLDCLHQNIISPLCNEIETYLRLHTHNLILGNPFQQLKSGQINLEHFIQMKSFPIVTVWFSIKNQIEDYLNTQFYNLNALQPSDWRTYEEMRHISHDRFKLNLQSGFLPGTVVDPGLDVLVITKNIHVFVSHYTYSINDQQFIQRPECTESKQLHTLSVRHITNSIQTHGSGIVNTTVNFIFKYVVKKLSILSQFLFDDHIKSRLIKEEKYFNENKERLNNIYPMDRAEKHMQDFKKLGLLEDNKTYLDQVRILITEIGNSLGYMRMVRSGAMRSLSHISVFIPEIEHLVQLEKKVNPAAKPIQDDAISDSSMDTVLDIASQTSNVDPSPSVEGCTLDSIKLIDETVFGLKKRMTKSLHVFRVLHESIADKIKDVIAYDHLKYFYLLVPPLCLSFISQMVQHRERLVNKKQVGTYSDDGFTMGCTFLLSLFGLQEQFDSLHWFEGAVNHFKSRETELKNEIARRKQMTKKEVDEDMFSMKNDEVNSILFSLSVLSMSLDEFKNLAASFQSTTVFFRYTPDNIVYSEASDTDSD